MAKRLALQSTKNSSTQKKYFKSDLIYFSDFHRELIDQAMRELAQAARRREIASPAICGVPVWEITLHLFIAALQERNMSVAELTKIIGYSESRNMRCLRAMESENRITFSISSAGLTDRAVLTQECYSAICAYLCPALEICAVY